MHTVWTTLWTTGDLSGTTTRPNDIRPQSPALRPHGAPSAVHVRATLGGLRQRGSRPHRPHHLLLLLQLSLQELCFSITVGMNGSPGGQDRTRQADRPGRRHRGRTDAGTTHRPRVRPLPGWSYGGTPRGHGAARSQSPARTESRHHRAAELPVLPVSYLVSRSTATVEVFSMKFRVARDDLADAVAWVAKSLPTRPPVPVLGGILLEVRGSTLTVAGFDYEVSTRATVSVDTLESFPDADDAAEAPGRAGAGVRPAAGRDHQVAAGQAGRPGRRRAAGVHRRRIRPVHPADHAGRGLPAAAADAGLVRARSTPRCSPRPSRRPRSPPAATTRCRC